MNRFLLWIDTLSLWVGKSVCLADPRADAGRQLRSVRALCARRADELGLRFQLHQLRRPVPDGWSLHALAQRARARGCAVPLLEAAHAGEHGPRALHHLLPARGAGLHLCGLELRRDVDPVQGSQHLQPRWRAGVSAQDTGSGDRCSPAAARDRRNHPLRDLHPQRRVAAAPAGRGGDRKHHHAGAEASRPARPKSQKRLRREPEHD